MYPRVFTKEEIAELDFNEYTTEEIKHLISCASIKESDVINFYGNEFWDDFTS